MILNNYIPVNIIINHELNTKTNIKQCFMS